MHKSKMHPCEGVHPAKMCRVKLIQNPARHEIFHAILLHMHIKTLYQFIIIFIEFQIFFNIEEKNLRYSLSKILSKRARIKFRINFNLIINSIIHLIK